MRRFIYIHLIALNMLGCLSTTTIAIQREAEAQLTKPPWSPPKPTRNASTSSIEPVTMPTCAALAEHVLANHPRIHAGQARVRSAIALSKAEGSLPSPTISAEVWDFPIGKPANANREGMYMVGVGQEFSPAGAREGRSRAEAEESLAKVAEVSEAARELRSQITHTCTDWSGAELVRERLNAHRAILAEMKEAMLSRYSTGGEALGAIARAEAELAAAERHVIEAEEEVLVARATLSALAGKDTTLPDKPPPLPPISASIDLEELLQLAISSRADLAAAEARRRSANAQTEAAAAEAKVPTFEVRATYMQTPAMRAGLGAMVSMSLPWLWGGGSERRTSARHDAEATKADSADVDRTVRVEVTRATSQVRAFHRSLSALIGREIPAARQALSTERAALTAGEFNLTAWIQAAHAVREAHVDEARVRSALEHAWIDLETSVGHPLPRTPAVKDVQP